MPLAIDVRLMEQEGLATVNKNTLFAISLAIALFIGANTSTASNDRCEVEEEVNRTKLEHQQKYLHPASDNYYAILNEMRKIWLANGWDESSPFDERQLSGNDRSRFRELTVEDTVNKIDRLIESRRSRDIEFIRDASLLVDKWYGSNPAVEDTISERDQDITNFVYAVRKALSSAEQELLDYSPSNLCTLSEALKLRAMAVYESTRENQSYVDAIPLYVELIEKYGDNIESSKITDNERREYFELKATIEALFLEILHASTLYWLSVFEDLSIEATLSYRIDAEKFPGDVDNLGRTWNSWVAEPRFSSSQMAVYKYYASLDEYFPSDFVKQIPPTKP